MMRRLLWKRGRTNFKPTEKVDFVNADECTMTSATITTNEFCQLIKSGNGGESGGSDKEAHGTPTLDP
jgi:hypothetical protein